jgi:uncharacterized membrane protein YhaH (DUF805 family)
MNNILLPLLLVLTLFFTVLGVWLLISGWLDIKKKNAGSSPRSDQNNIFYTAYICMIVVFRRYFSFIGAVSRKEFLLTAIVIGAMSTVFLMLSFWLQGVVGGSLLFLTLLLSTWATWALSVKRTRDTGITVWWVLALLIPPVNLAAMAFLFLVPSNEFKGRGL